MRQHAGRTYRRSSLCPYSHQPISSVWTAGLPRTCSSMSAPPVGPPAAFCVASTMAPKLRLSPCTVPGHRMVRKGSLVSSRRATNRLMTFIARGCRPITTPSQLRLGNTAASAAGTGVGHVNVLGYLSRSLRQVDQLPSALGPTPKQLGPAVGTVLQSVLHSVGGRHARSGKAVAARLAWTFGLGWLPVAFGFQTRHPAGACGFGLPFQLGNPFLQPFNDRLLPDDDANENIPATVRRSISVSIPVI